MSHQSTEVSEVQLLTRENRFANFIGKSFLIYAKIAASVTLDRVARYAILVARGAIHVACEMRRDW